MKLLEHIFLKNSGICVPRLCVGGCPFGQYGWGQVNEECILDAIAYSMDNELSFFDTADVYGLGKSEELLGKALIGKRHNAVIATKCGVRIKNEKTFYDNSNEWIKSACTGSLNRLQTDYIDIYQIHYRDGMTPLADIVESLDYLKAKGYIRAYGLSNIHEKDRNELLQFTGLFCLFQDEYSLACRKNEDDILMFSKYMSLTPLTWGSLGQGVLTGKYSTTGNASFGKDDRRSRQEYVNFHGEKFLNNLKIVEVISKISAETGKSHAAIALRFILDYIADSCVIAGVKNRDQVKSNMQALDWNLSDKHIIKLLDISKKHK